MAYGYAYGNQTVTPNSYFNANYTPPPLPMSTAQQQQVQPQTNVNWIYVNGIQGARDHIVQPGQTVWMMDNNEPVIYVKAVDMMGSTTFKAMLLTDYNISNSSQNVQQSAVDTSQFVKTDDFDKLSARIGELENRLSTLVNEIGGLNT